MSPEQILRAALEGTDPPDPPTPAEDGDRGDGHHHHVHFIAPVVMLFSDGSTRTDGWKGTAVQTACTVAVSIVIWQAVWALVGWAAGARVYDVPLLYLVLVTVAVVALLLLAFVGLYWLGAGLRAGWRRWRARRAPK